jgi:addiction module HigA family antidote
MEPLELSSNALARSLGITPARVKEIVRRRRGVTADTALRLARYSGTDAQSWLNLQTIYDLRTAELGHGRVITKTVSRRTRFAEGSKLGSIAVRDGDGRGIVNRVAPARAPCKKQRSA